ncbi:MAG: response regulator [Planctomycetota bacterium]
MKPISVLIVDDDEIDRYLLRRDLKRTGLEAGTIECADGGEALAFLEDYDANKKKHGDGFPPQVVFLDINMPKVSGFDFLEAFDKMRRERDDYSTCVIMMFTSSAHPDDRERATKFDFVREFIVKGETPPEELGAKVKAALAG